MPLTGMGGFGSRLAEFGGTAAGANAATALFGDRYGSRPRYDPFLRGITGFAYRAGGGYADPGARYEGAVGQAGNALLALLKGASPTAPYRPGAAPLRPPGGGGTPRRVALQGHRYAPASWVLYGRPKKVRSQLGVHAWPR